MPNDDDEPWGAAAIAYAANDKRQQCLAIGRRDIKAWRTYDETCPAERAAMERILTLPWPRLSK